MVSTLTFIILTITFLVAHYIFDKNAKHLFKNRKGWHIITLGIILEGIMIFLAAHITVCFYVLLYGTVIIASFIESFYRFKNAELIITK